MLIKVFYTFVTFFISFQGLGPKERRREKGEEERVEGGRGKLHRRGGEGKGAEPEEKRKSRTRKWGKRVKRQRGGGIHGSKERRWQNGRTFCKEKEKY